MRTLWIIFLALITAATSFRPAAVHESKTWVVWPGSSIQTAIQQARDGDTVLVQPGRYPAGLDFLGKAITVRGSQPDEVILDASGQAWIVRFWQDEGPGSVLENVSIIPDGKTFELSAKAHPTTRGIRIVGAGLEPPSAGAPREPTLPEASQMAVAVPPRLGWDGLNPFFQPAWTTAFTGSGDVNRDGQISQADVDLAQQMASGQAASLPEADVNGDGSVTGADTVLLQQSADHPDNILPGWWNQLTTRAQRNAWVDRALALDPTDLHPYYFEWFLCYNFSVQTYANLAYDRADLFDTLYSGGQSVFNLPVYVVGVYAPDLGFAHDINAILVGDNPLNFFDWRFFEPQDDTTVIPGNWDMPYGSQLDIQVYDQIGSNHSRQTNLLRFQVDNGGGVSLLSYNPGLTLVRPASPPPSVQPMDDRPDAFDPQIVPIGPNGLLLYERQRDDLSRVTDLHLAYLPLASTDMPDNQGLVQDTQFSRLLDWTKGPDGQIYLLWRGKPGYSPGLFYGRLDPSGTGSITGISRVASVLFPREGRLVIRPNGEVLAVWLDLPIVRDNPNRGIYWSRLGSGGWEAAQNLTPDFAYLDGDWPGWVNRDFFRYVFDTSVSPDGQVTLAWLEQESETSQAILAMDYDGSAWSSEQTIDSTNARGLALAAEASGSLHLVYWTGKLRDQYDEEGRGALVERVRTGGVWGPPAVLDNSIEDCCVDLAAGPDGQIGMVWERRVSMQVVPVWRRYQDGSWGDEQVLSLPEGTNAWYPQLTWLPNARIGLAWSQRSNELNALGVWEENRAPTGISLGASSIAENQPVNTPIGALATADPDFGNTFTYSLVKSAQCPGTDNDAFTIQDGVLLSAESFNFEAKTSYTICVRSTDQGTLAFDKAFMITVTNVNEAPAEIKLSESEVVMKAPAGTTVGTLTADDPDTGDTLTFILTPAYVDNNQFMVSGNVLNLSQQVTRHRGETYSIQVQVSDAGSLSVQQTFIIQVVGEYSIYLPSIMR